MWKRLGSLHYGGGRKRRCIEEPASGSVHQRLSIPSVDLYSGLNTDDDGLDTRLTTERNVNRGKDLRSRLGLNRPTGVDSDYHARYDLRNRLNARRTADSASNTYSDIDSNTYSDVDSNTYSDVDIDIDPELITRNCVNAMDDIDPVEGQTEMSLEWRNPRESSRQADRSLSWRSRDGSQESDIRVRTNWGRGRGRAGRRTNSPLDIRRGAKSLDVLYQPFVDKGSGSSNDRSSSERGRALMHIDGFSRGSRSRSKGNIQTRGNRDEGRNNELSDYDPSLSNIGGNSTRFHGKRQPRREREHPIGMKDLERLLTLPSDAVVLELLREQSGFHILLKEDAIQDHKFFLLIQVLAFATNTKSNKENLYQLFTVTCEQRFIDRLCAFSMAVKRKYLDKAKAYFSDLLLFLNAYANAMTNIAIDRVPSLIDVSISVLLYLKQQAFVSQDLVDKYEALQNMLSEASKHWEYEKGLTSHERKRRRDEMDTMEPPDDFRQLSVLPTSQDLVETKRPFLRKNIVEGKYKDENHYLDVQFRLLREDFVKPLRNGIADFRGNKKSRVKDIRIYRGVSIVGTEFNNRKMVHLVQLNLPRHIKSIENSKRLLFGNLLCFSHDNFKTLIFASVAERDADRLKKEGVIGVQFESDINEVNLASNFVMAESRAYFMAYKHVLQALKDLADNGVPMAPYILHVIPNIDAPKYLEDGEKYDLRVMKDMKIMKKEEALNMLIDFGEDTHELDDLEMPHLREIFIQRDLMAWPSEHELGLDGSQRRALRSALTRQMAIIQGPPGTGKTFIGLKITQILLHNSHVWKDEDHPTPILVVCFTNHALDQFLEGMTPYTKSIVRVGSRTKSESISRFQVNSLIRSLQGVRGLPSAIHQMNISLRHDVMMLEHEIKRLRSTLNACRHPEGIIYQENFSTQSIIPKHLDEQLSQVGLCRWLLLSVSPEMLGKIERRKKSLTPFGKWSDETERQNQSPVAPFSDKTDEGSESNEEDFNDAEEFLGQEEQERLLGCNDSDTDDDGDDVAQLYKVKYELTDEKLAEEMAQANAALEKDQNNVEAYFKYTILSGQRDALKIGLGLSVDSESVMALEREPYLNLMRLDFPSRWKLYRYWSSKLEAIVSKQLTKVESSYQRKSRALEEIKNQQYLYLMRNAAVVGMTTTGAAQYNNLMQDLAPAIVIIEEAAEILESHVITSLTAKCQHLIMIGDHQQLRPSATVFELATKYGLDTSLFERMIKNGLAYETLEYQHRMRPSISRLLVPSIYRELKDHSSVALHPHIKGITKDVFFINHDIPEREESDDNNSHENEHEAELLIGLSRHLMLQGYSPEEVTILTPYSGQFFLLRKLQRQHSVCQGVKICVVDNFQGEENNIILLSLVRSNEEGKVGFLSSDNRVCVALSRAKHGLYITGNMQLLSNSSKLWKTIKDDLIKDGSFGNSLTLKCENHPDELVSITEGADFFSKSPEGGCLQTCNKKLPNCIHTCPRLCHMDDLDHKSYKCREPCPKILCELDHLCPKLCHEICSPCKIPVKKTFPCNHINTIPCHVAPVNFRCPIEVTKELDSCQHLVQMPCYHDTKTFTCPLDCDTRLDCGHQCRLKCHRTRDPDHFSYNCKQMCVKLNAGCTQNHPCQRYCYEDCGNCIVKIDKKLPCGHEAKNVECYTPPEEIQCKKNCKKTLPCGHACKKLCHQTCGNCPVKVKKIVPDCQHEIWVDCGLPPTTDRCGGKCVKSLPCGHQCLEKCKDACTTKCMEMVLTTSRCPKNHLIKMPCHLKDKVTGEDAWVYCDTQCLQTLNCSHQCSGRCGDCLQGRLHMSCKKPCNKTLVCGHICKHPCSTDCPPCQEDCSWKCQHSRCRKKCGIPCAFCKEKCKRRCPHQQCSKLCGKQCSVPPCQHPCTLKLKCGHPCIGFCGDPCPPLCRICNDEELKEFILLGYEEDADARFVWLEDCGHSIEVQGLEGWLNQENVEIGMKTCPRCRKAIYNNRRYQDIILDTYKDVYKVKTKYFTSKCKVKRKDIELLLQEPGVTSQFPTEVRQILKALGFGPSKDVKSRKQTFCSEGELRLYLFQSQVLKKATSIILKSTTAEEQASGSLGVPSFMLRRRTPSKHQMRLKPRVLEVVKRVMEKTVIIAPQMEDEISCELQRLLVLPAYWKFLEKLSGTLNSNLKEIGVKLDKLMDPTVKYEDVLDKKVRTLLKESEQYVGGLGISQGEKLMILKAMGLRQGHWYKCPYGHVYCITECGGAMIESNCPDCGSRIGGNSHRLRSDNAVASEMDGARHGAWSEHNNMRNFMDDII